MQHLKKRGGVNHWKRTYYLYIHLWLIYLFILPIACYVRPDFYPGSFQMFVENAISWRSQYIGEQWFFLPYIILMLASVGVFKIYDKLKWYWVLGFLLGLWLTTIYTLKRCGIDNLSNNMLFYNLFLAFYLLPSFTLGYMANRFDWFNIIKKTFKKHGKYTSIIYAVILLIICILRCFIPNSTIGPYFAIVFILIFSQIPVGKISGRVLTYLGAHSMNIWLIHTWFSTRLFHSFFFDVLQHPILIYITLLIISLSVSHIVEYLYKHINYWINPVTNK